jgi:3-hydroxyacyl-CoA dehydrogenase
MGHKALARLDSDFDALVIGNDAASSSAPGPTSSAWPWPRSRGCGKSWTDDQGLQPLTFNLRHAPKPVVTAVHQAWPSAAAPKWSWPAGKPSPRTRATWAWSSRRRSDSGRRRLQGGAAPQDQPRHANPQRRRAARRCKRPLSKSPGQGGTSAWEAKELGYLRESDLIVMNSEHRFAKAKQRALQLVASGARPPEVEKIYAAGRDVYYALLMGVKSLEWGGFASEHDVVIARKLAYVLCGGDISAGAWVDPWTSSTWSAKPSSPSWASRKQSSACSTCCKPENRCAT